MNETKPTQIPLEARGASICVIEGGPAIARVLWGSRNPEICISKEYAAEIAKDMAVAMNTHDDMLAALKAARPLINAMSKEPWALDTALDETLSIIDAAIAKAKGGAK